MPLLPLIYSPLMAVRRGMANLLTHLIFTAAHLAQQRPDEQQNKQHGTADHAVPLPACFLNFFRFSCKVEPVHFDQGPAVMEDATRHAQVPPFLWLITWSDK